jgi:hypothetical protein
MVLCVTTYDHRTVHVGRCVVLVITRGSIILHMTINGGSENARGVVNIKATVLLTVVCDHMV